MTQQVDWAMALLKTNHELLPRILSDLRNSLDDVRSAVKPTFGGKADSDSNQALPTSHHRAK